MMQKEILEIRLNLLADKLIEGHSSATENLEFKKLYSLLRQPDELSETQY